VPSGNSTPATKTQASCSECPPPSELVNQEIRSPQVYFPASVFHVTDVHELHPQKVFTVGEVILK